MTVSCILAQDTLLPPVNVEGNGFTLGLSVCLSVCVGVFVYPSDNF